MVRNEHPLRDSFKPDYFNRNKTNFNFNFKLKTITHLIG